MDSIGIKDIDTRIREAIEIRSRLRDTGILACEQLDLALKHVTNAFISDAAPSDTVVNVPDARVRITLASQRNRDSGVVISPHPRK